MAVVAVVVTMMPLLMTLIIINILNTWRWPRHGDPGPRVCGASRLLVSSMSIGKSISISIILIIIDKKSVMATRCANFGTLVIL